MSTGPHLWGHSLWTYYSRSKLVFSFLGFEKWLVFCLGFFFFFSFHLRLPSLSFWPSEMLEFWNSLHLRRRHWMVKKHFSAVHQLSWLALPHSQSSPASWRSKIAAIRTLLWLAGLVRLIQDSFSVDGFGTILFRDKTNGRPLARKTDVQTVHSNSCKEEEAFYWNRVTRSLFTARTAESSCLYIWKGKWLRSLSLFNGAFMKSSLIPICWMWKFPSKALLYVDISFLLQSFVVALWWCKYLYKTQSLELLPSLTCLERKEPAHHCSVSLNTFQHSPTQKHSSHS